MKKAIVCLMMLLLLFWTAEANDKTKDDKTAAREIYKVYRGGNSVKALKMVEKAIKTHGMTMKLIHLKFLVLTALDRDKEALAFIDEAIKKQGEKEEFLSARSNVLIKMGNLPEALKTALHKDKIAKTKSPWEAMNILDIHLRMRSKEDALDWLQEAVNRGFISYRILEQKKYSLMHKDKRFYDIIKSIKMSIGLGRRARNFQARLLNGEMFNLWRQKGKVVLVHFWATWCGECYPDIQGLKKSWEQFKDKGLEIISISLDENEKRLKETIGKYKMEWKHSCTGKGWQDPTAVRCGINSVPSYWLVDKKGILRSFNLKGRELNRTIAILLSE
jgi:thiol-disulfide isomerase/thioredoxin